MSAGAGEGLQFNAGRFQSCPDTGRHFHRAGRISVDAQGVGPDLDHCAVRGHDFALGGQPHGPLNDRVDVVQHGALLRARNQRSVRPVGAVHERFDEHRVSGFLWPA